MALMSVNNRNVARSIGSPAATLHPTEAKYPCWESHVCKLYAGLSRWPTSGVQVPFQPKKVCGEKHYCCIRKKMAERRGNSFRCAGHRPGPWNLAGISVILKVNTTLGQLILPPAVQVIPSGRAVSQQRKGWVGKQRRDFLLTPG